MYKKTLTSVDAAIGAVILDAQNIALLIPVTAKQTLAARWQVLILIPAQILGLVFLPVLVVKFTKGRFASQDCKCLTIFWWSRLSDCNAFSGNELSLFWIYYTLRWMMWIHSSFHSLYNAEWFHRSEKEGRIPILNRDGTKPKTYWDKAIALARELRDSNRQVTKATLQAGLLYRQYSATISVSYTAYALYSLTSMVVAEVTIGEYNLQPSSNANSIGQIIAVVVSLATLLRVIWSFQSLYNDAENSSFPDFIFSLLSRSPSSCCFGSDVEEVGEDPASILSRPDEEELGRISDTDSGHDGSGESLPPQTPARSSQSSRGAVDRPDQYLGPNPGSPHPSNSRNSSDSANLPKTQPHLSLGQNGRAQRLPPNRAVPQPKRTDSYGPAYRFEFRQPFHLDAVKLLFLPTVTQYLEVRRKVKATTPMSEHPVSPPVKLPKPVQPMARTPSQQPQQHMSREKALPSSLVVEVPHPTETSTSDDNQHPVVTSSKPSDLIGVEMIPKTEPLNTSDEDPIGTSHQGSWKYGHPYVHVEEDKYVPIQSGPLEKREVSSTQEPGEDSPAPVSIFGDGRIFPANRFVSDYDLNKTSLKSKTEQPDIANQSKGGGEPQEPSVQTEKGRASPLFIVANDTGSDMDGPRTIGQSAKSVEPVDETSAQFKDAKNVIARPLFRPHENWEPESTRSSPSEMKPFAWRRRRRMQAILRWDFVLHELGILSRNPSGGQGSVGETTETAVPDWELPRKGLPLDDIMSHLEQAFAKRGPRPITATNGESKSGESEIGGVFKNGSRGPSNDRISNV
ncbi:hypothetical protein J4E93_001207 [Alternaria ventricosa]|uniref:uncharacterized protein n=1 Tax=Alternaria ventricosa TaxID=1187951 RepID=UPI0020C4EB6C|nr:uncharacterized protein J4E93_001207 [Alternaria ventricosa]KAI4653441.1 hypothetical protein J4E93_001207 [Alternaria ventricosa]